MNTPPKRIGIIGGMGPAATVLLQQRIIAFTDAGDDADHIPTLVDNNPQIPSRIGCLIEGHGADPGPVIVAMAQALESAKVAALAMPCNTAHHYADTIRNAVSIPLLDMVNLSAILLRNQLDSPGQGRIGMLVSPAVRRVGVFNAAFEELDLQAVYLDDDTPLLELIRAVKGHGVSPNALEQMRTLAARFRTGSVDALLIGCSELSLLSAALPGEPRWVDSLDVLAHACVNFALARES